MQDVIKKIVRFGLVKLVYPFYHLLNETFRKECVVISTSVKPFRYNWGDYVSVILCGLINPGIKFIPRCYTWNVRKKDDVLCIGSIITWMTTPRSIIWGSGIVYPEREISAIPKKVLAVRGPLTRKYLLDRGIDCPEIFGDPALLFPRYYKPKRSKKYKLGIIPHFRDKENMLLEKFRNDKDILIIDVQNVHPWTKFIDDICSCEYIASSSLHGIIVSDAYNVPNVWVEFAEGERKVFAFKDYLSSVGRENESAFSFDKNTTMEKIIERVQTWHSITIDLNKLISVCPFLLK